MKQVESVEQVSFHRNGIGGQGFYAVLFTRTPPAPGEFLDRPGLTERERRGRDIMNAARRMVGIVFDEPGHCAILAVEPLSSPDVGAAFGLNSWRGDCFEEELRDAIREHGRVGRTSGSVRVGPFAVPTEE